MQERHVLANELFLQTDGMRGDDDAALFAGARGLNRGDEIREALADASPRLDHEMFALRKRIGHGAGHGELLGACFVVRQPSGDRAVRS